MPSYGRRIPAITRAASTRWSRQQLSNVMPYTVAPPFFRLLWALGLDVPPPLFLGFLTLMLLMGTFFGIFWGAFMWLLLWHAWHAVDLVVLLYGPDL